MILTKKGNRKIRRLTNDIIHGRSNYSPQIRNFLANNGHKTIVALTIKRDPIMSMIQKSLDFLSGGKIEYDKLFHLRLIADFDDGSKCQIEKNEVINISGKIDPSKNGGNSMQIQEPIDITLTDFLQNAQNRMGDKYFRYSGYDNNCQDYILNCLAANSINNATYNFFIKQDTAAIFRGNPILRKLSNTVTDIAARGDVLISGSGLKNKCKCFRLI